MGMRVKPADFQRLNLRCHALLSDVPLHDVWAIPLSCGGPVKDPGRACDLVRRPTSTHERRGARTLRTAIGPGSSVRMG